MWHDPIEPCPDYDELWQGILDLETELASLSAARRRAWTWALAGWLAFALAVAALMIAL